MAATDKPSLMERDFFINNEYVPSGESKTFALYNPATEEFITTVPIAGRADVDAAVNGAWEAFKHGPWSTFTGPERAKCMLKLAQLIEENIDELVALETITMGQPAGLKELIKGATVDAWRCEYYEHGEYAGAQDPTDVKGPTDYAGWADKLAGETFRPEAGGPLKIVTHEPLGVCAGIAPWNSSHSTFAWKAAPALAAGNTLVFKSSEKSPLGIAAMGTLIKAAGFPPGVIQILSGGGDTGALLAAHMKVAKISFTGSVATGKKIQEAAARSNLKRVTLELGGKSPAIVFDDANLDNAVKHCTMGLLINSGQACFASSRILVHRPIAPRFLTAMQTAFSAITAGMRNKELLASESEELGPLVDREQFERVLSFIENTKQANEATLLVGGGRVGQKGYYVEPTLFTDPKPDASIYRHEIFGPVGVVRTFETEEEAVCEANNTSFGLSATVFTGSTSRGLRISARLEAGSVGINTMFVPDVQAPFGGWKESGQGREMGREGLMAFLETKTTHINLDI